MRWKQQNMKKMNQRNQQHHQNIKTYKIVTPNVDDIAMDFFFLLFHACVSIFIKFKQCAIESRKKNCIHFFFVSFCRLCLWQSVRNQIVSVVTIIALSKWSISLFFFSPIFFFYHHLIALSSCLLSIIWWHKKIVIVPANFKMMKNRNSIWTKKKKVK